VPFYVLEHRCLSPSSTLFSLTRARALSLPLSGLCPSPFLSLSLLSCSPPSLFLVSRVNFKYNTQFVAVCCSMLQCVTVCCSVLHCVAVCCSVLQCVAVCCRGSQISRTFDLRCCMYICIYMHICIYTYIYIYVNEYI